MKYHLKVDAIYIYRSVIFFVSVFFGLYLFLEESFTLKGLTCFILIFAGVFYALAFAFYKTTFLCVNHDRLEIYYFGKIKSTLNIKKISHVEKKTKLRGLIGLSEHAILIEYHGRKIALAVEGQERLWDRIENQMQGVN